MKINSKDLNATTYDKTGKKDERINKMKYNNIHMVDEINIHLNKDSN